VKSLRDTEEFKRGRNGERIVARLLQLAGYAIVPSYDYAGEDGEKAPRLQGIRESWVIPDLDIGQDGTRFWVEVKTKQAATLRHITGIYEHGMSLRQYQHYLEVQRITGTSVWLFVYEEDTDDVLFERLDRIALFERLYHGNKMGRSGMVFFPRDRFRLFANLQHVNFGPPSGQMVGVP